MSMRKPIKLTCFGTCWLTGDDGAPTVGHLLALQLGQLGLVPALLAGEGAALLVGDLVTLGAGHVDALLLLHGLALPLVDVGADLLGHLAALLLGHLAALLGDDVPADRGVVHLLADLPGHRTALLGVLHLALLLVRSLALLAALVLKENKE